MAHLYASFADASLAEKAAGALLDYGVKQEDISLVAHENHAATRETMYGTQGGANPNAGYETAGTTGYGTATGAAAGLGNGPLRRRATGWPEPPPEPSAQKAQRRATTQPPMHGPMLARQRRRSMITQPALPWAAT